MKDRTNMFNRSKSSSMLMKVFVSVATVSLLSGTVECFSPGWGATRDALAVQTYGQNDGQGIVDPQWTGLDRTAKASRHSLTLSMSSPSASGSEPKKPSSTSSTTRRPKKTLQDRTEEETRSLIQDLVQAAVEAGPRAGPARTLEAYFAVSKTIQDFLPQPGKTPEPFSAPVALRKLFERLGATYIKLGQFVASSPTLFPNEYVVEFQKCLDKTESLEWNVIKRVIEREIGTLPMCISF